MPLEQSVRHRRTTTLIHRPLHSLFQAPKRFFKILLLVQIRLGGDGGHLAKLHVDVVHENADTLFTALDAS